MSLPGELVRLGLRWMVKRRSQSQTIEQARQRLAAMEALAPRPPASTRTMPVNAGGVNADRITTPTSDATRNILFLHGGGYTTGSPALYRHFTWRLAATARGCVLAIDYRLAPEHPFAAALEDAVAAYLWLLDCGADPRLCAVIGDSAGGGLALAMLMKLRDDGVPLPGCAVVLSPWTDLALTGLSLRANAAADPMLRADSLAATAELYLAGADPRTPYASPLYGDPAALPPTLIQVGSDEILRDDATRMAERMRAAGCRVAIEIWPRMPHVWHLFAPVLPEARQAIARIGSFIRCNP